MGGLPEGERVPAFVDETVVRRFPFLEPKLQARAILGCSLVVASGGGGAVLGSGEGSAGTGGASGARKKRSLAGAGVAAGLRPSAKRAEGSAFGRATLGTAAAAAERYLARAKGVQWQAARHRSGRWTAGGWRQARRRGRRADVEPEALAAKVRQPRRRPSVGGC
ncbi:hypothetical protein NL676_011292 [Syzygium grande]|nr:hypothetical protein NL676_011292 [Syzygium grande]